MRNLFSVIIPSYNRAPQIRRAIDSVLNQTFGNFEIIVVDDGSTDNTDEIVSMIVDKRIVYKKIRNSGGPARPRNVGIDSAKGEWVCFLDSDDWWRNDKLEICASVIHDGVDFIYHDLFLVQNDKPIRMNTRIRARRLNSPILTNLLVGGNCISNSSVVLRKKIISDIGGFDESKEMIASEDYNMWLRCSEVTEKYHYINKPLGFYLNHDSGISKRDMSISEKCAINKWLPLLDTIQRSKVNSRISYTSGRYKYLKGDFIGAKTDLLKSIKYSDKIIKIKSLCMLANIIVRGVVNEK
jgi:glycosyltransferase involved in cell wall biosynthesis